MDAGLYLKSITLRNFATFENQVITFHKGFNGIVGETGSGKSLILDAFQLLLGARSDKKLVRRDSECAIIEGHFKVSNKTIQKYFDELGFPIEENDQIIIKRIIYNNGKSKSFLNHMSCPANTLVSFSKKFVDMVGQFENQKLGSSDYQLYLLDQYTGVSKDLVTYQEIFTEYKTSEAEISNFEIKLGEKKQREDYLRFQLEELSELEPSQEREDQLIQLKNRLLNKEGLQQELEELKNLSSEGEFNILSSLKQISKSVNSKSGLFDSQTTDLIENITSLFEDFSYQLSMKDLDEDEETSLEDVLEELDRYQKLKRKFNIDTASLGELYLSFQAELDELATIDSNMKKLRALQEKREVKLYDIAKDIHVKREKAAKKLGDQITKGLSNLNMKGATFQISVTKTEILTSTGLSKVRFMAETNPGEGFHKIKDIASGGELSRILLTLRQIVASEDSISIFFFDEIDTGIGGETAQRIAEALKKVSDKGQVLAITHLPQIAKSVDEIIFVDKKSYSVDDSVRTVSFVENKSGKDREEVINILAGL